MVAIVNSTEKLSTVMKCDCWICITASALSAAAINPTRRLKNARPIRNSTSRLRLSARAERCRPGEPQLIVTGLAGGSGGESE